MASMNLLTFLARVSDSMLLVETLDNPAQMREYKRRAKDILKQLSAASPKRCTIQAGPFLYFYIIDETIDVCFLTLAEKSYPRKLAFQFLEELQNKFRSLHGSQVATFSRPYAAVSFDPKMNLIRKEYLNPNSQQNVERLGSELTEIHNIMVSNIQEVLKRGEKLETIQDMSSNLLADSKKFDRYSKWVNIQYLYRTYGPIAAVVVIILLVIWFRFF